MGRTTEERRIAHQRRDSGQMTVCHISKIPAETLMSIFFSSVLEYDMQNDYRSVMCGTSPPLVFLSTCKRWRQLAMNQSALWSTLRVCAKRRKDVRMMSRWLQFAQQQPLSIYLETVDSMPDIADLALDVILEHQSSWFQISLDWAVQNRLPLLGHAFTPSQAPLLQKFTIITSFDGGDINNGESKTDARLGQLLAGSSQMRSFTWATEENEDMVDPVRLSVMPFSCLRELALSCLMTLPGCLEVLRHTPLLECCAFTYVQRSFMPLQHQLEHLSSSSEPIRLLHLRSFCVKTNLCVGDFLDMLILPSLKSIEVVIRMNCQDEDSLAELAEYFDPWPHAEFLSLLLRSGCPLEELILATPVAEDELLEYLQISSLTMKTIFLRGKLGWASIGQRALNLLTILPGGTDAILCPNLGKISFEDCITERLPQNSMADMIQSRLIYSTVDCCGSPMGVYLAAPKDFVDEEDWRRLHVLRQRSAGKANITLMQLPRHR